MDINNLTKEEKARLKAQLEAEERAEQARIQQERQTYKDLVNTTVMNNLKKLQRLSSEMMLVKQQVFSDFDTLIRMKNDLFKVKGDRRSDTFTTTDGSCSITLGNRVNEGWDDTVNVGIEKVKNYLATLAKDEDSADLIDTVMGLLAKDRKGNLKASKVLELERLAVKKQNKMFLDGIAIIKDSYRPVPTCQFVEVEMKDENGNPVKLPLSLAAMK